MSIVLDRPFVAMQEIKKEQSTEVKDFVFLIGESVHNPDRILIPDVSFVSAYKKAAEISKERSEKSFFPVRVISFTTLEEEEAHGCD